MKRSDFLKYFECEIKKLEKLIYEKKENDEK